MRNTIQYLPTADTTHDALLHTFCHTLRGQTKIRTWEIFPIGMDRWGVSKIGAIRSYLGLLHTALIRQLLRLSTPTFGKAMFCAMETGKVIVHVHAHKKLAHTANISTVHEQFLLKF